MATSAIFSKYAEYYDLFNQDKPYKDEIKFVYNWADKPRWLFDIGCATGKYWKFYPKSINIFGVDKSQEMLDKINDPRLVGYDAADIANYSHIKKFDCATALFDVINYIPKHDWWKNLPIKKGGYFIFDIWDKKKVDKDGFQKTVKYVGGLVRTIRPGRYDGRAVELEIEVAGGDKKFKETHKMCLYSHEDIERFCGDEFKIIEVKPTERWQAWYKCKRK